MLRLYTYEKHEFAQQIEHLQAAKVQCSSLCGQDDLVDMSTQHAGPVLASCIELSGQGSINNTFSLMNDGNDDAASSAIRAIDAKIDDLNSDIAHYDRLEEQNRADERKREEQQREQQLAVMS
jgi:hypothetical protein